MKSAYELVMERLNRTAPQKKLTDEQRARLAELDSRYRARMAEREIGLRGQIAQAEAAGDAGAVDQLRQQLGHEIKKLEAELEEKKEAVRQGG